MSVFLYFCIRISSLTFWVSVAACSMNINQCRFTTDTSSYGARAGLCQKNARGYQLLALRNNFICIMELCANCHTHIHTKPWLFSQEPEVPQLTLQMFPCNLFCRTRAQQLRAQAFRERDFRPTPSSEAQQLWYPRQGTNLLWINVSSSLKRW